MHNRARRLAIVAGVAALALIGSPKSSAQSPRSGGLALVGGTVYVDPTQPPIAEGVVTVRDGKIAAVGRKGAVSLEGLEVIDSSGLMIVAGFWNSHVHFIERKWAGAAQAPAAELDEPLRDMLTQYGFTSVFDTGSTWANTKALRDRIESGEVTGPRIHSTGDILFPKGGAPAPLILDVLGAMRIAMPEVDTADEARAAAQKNLDAGTDGIKVYAVSLGWPARSLSEAAIRAAADVAHERKKLVFAHPHTREGLLASVQGGADVLVHTAPNAGVLGDAILAAMKRANVAVIPTLKLWRHELRHERKSPRESFVAAGVDQLRAWSSMGGAVLFGTDVGYMDDYDPSDEYALMADAGMSPMQILASLTTAPAERFGESSERGRIAPGLAADLVALRGNPLRNVRAFADACYTIRGGRVLYAAGNCSAVTARGLR